MPASAELVATLRSDGIPAVLSGAGPAVLAFCDAAGAGAVAAAARRPWSARPVPVDAGGAVVLDDLSVRSVEAR
jgi:homoserine kinase